ncbi:beta-galactosidase [Prolixibacteraceae bacterium JC049]|nr:beta-galactosidase [Prolixibacteraceae bacterium JC049]
MNHKTILISLLFIWSATWSEAQNWKPVEGDLLTRWSKNVTPENAWREYPRPQMEREEWQNLNGLWQYAITGNDEKAPSSYEGNILVPFPIQSALSGVKKKVAPNQTLWYNRSFEVDKKWEGKDLLLHFEASDWHTRVWVNNELVGEHKGGYDPFSFNITSQLKNGKNELVVAVTDPTDKGWQPLGKQVLQPGGIFYTPVTGIWQTVWLEPVSKNHIQSVRFVPNIDSKTISIQTKTAQNTSAKVKATIFYKGKEVTQQEAVSTEKMVVKLKDCQLWEPGNPNLYDVELELVSANQVADKVKSYFGMRKIALGKDKNGFTSMLLNNKALFQNGPLDQGYWPDGIYTPPTEEAMIYDLKVTQQLGFNMLRKHVKVESRRFYYWCDKMGLLVWQDMPNGDRKIGPRDPDITRSAESEKQFRFELKQMIEKHYNHPSIVMWVPFNEGWGQFKTAEIVRWVKQLDPTRLVNNASGWTDRKVGDVHDIHNYPEPASPEPEVNRAVVLGEFGGLGLKVMDHMWESTNWGYSNLKSKEELLIKYENFYAEIWKLRERKGLSAAVYTQITDVETEANGLMTYDREVIKIDPKFAFDINTGNFVAAPEVEPMGGLINSGDTITLSATEGVEIRYTTDGSTPTKQSKLYTTPFSLKTGATVKVIGYRNSKSSRVVTAAFKETAIRRPHYKFSYSKKYSGGGNFALIDGITGGEKFSDGTWQGFHENNLDVLLDLQESRYLNEIAIRFIQDQGSWIFFPKQVTISVSSDGKVFSVLNQISIKTEPSKGKNETKRIAVFPENQKVKYVRIFAENVGKCPDWHTGKGGKAWLFADEVSFK